MTKNISLAILIDANSAEAYAGADFFINGLGS
jgi:hypothetical protein